MFHLSQDIWPIISRIERAPSIKIVAVAATDYQAMK
jgi:hypothetical protein